jgi:hypothetical protein
VVNGHWIDAKLSAKSAHTQPVQTIAVDEGERCLDDALHSQGLAPMRSGGSSMWAVEWGSHDTILNTTVT